LFLSTVFAGDERTERWRRPSTKTPTARPIRRFFGSEPAKLISIPTIAASYNDEMNHVAEATKDGHVLATIILSAEVLGKLLLGPSYRM